MNGKRKILKLTIPEKFLTKTPREIEHDAIKMEANMISRTQFGFLSGIGHPKFFRPRPNR